jgi:hypothetical protein
LWRDVFGRDSVICSEPDVLNIEIPKICHFIVCTQLHRKADGSAVDLRRDDDSKRRFRSECSLCWKFQPAFAEAESLDDPMNWLFLFLFLSEATQPV